MARRERPHRGAIRRLALLLGVAYLAMLAVNRSLVIVRGPSMEPSLWPGDALLTVPAHRWWLRPGQVVVVAPPDGPERVVKRVHRIERTGDRGAAGARRDRGAPRARGDRGVAGARRDRGRWRDGGRWVVDVRGDTPERSTDSRWWGPLPVRRVRRVAFARWPDVRTRLRRRTAVEPAEAPASPATPFPREAAAPAT